MDSGKWIRRQRADAEQAIGAQHANQGVSSRSPLFHSRESNDYVSKIESKIVLIDGSKLAELMIEFGMAVATDATFTVKRIDNDFFESRQSGKVSAEST